MSHSQKITASFRQSWANLWARTLHSPASLEINGIHTHGACCLSSWSLLLFIPPLHYHFLNPSSLSWSLFLFLILPYPSLPLTWLYLSFSWLLLLKSSELWWLPGRGVALDSKRKQKNKQVEKKNIPLQNLPAQAILQTKCSTKALAWCLGIRHPYAGCLTLSSCSGWNTCFHQTQGVLSCKEKQIRGNPAWGAASNVSKGIFHLQF